jgi:hypothetical protein
MVTIPKAQEIRICASCWRIEARTTALVREILARLARKLWRKSIYEVERGAQHSSIGDLQKN